MGKPSSIKGSEHSCRSSFNDKMKKIAPQKSNKRNKRKKRYKRKMNTVSKLLDNLKQTNISKNNSMCSVYKTVIDLDATENTPVTGNLNTNQNSLVICDDENCTKFCESVNLTSPICSSTPKHNSKVKLNQSDDQLINNNVSDINNEIINLTNTNEESYLTIDLTGDTVQQTSSTLEHTVIDLVNKSDNETSSLSNASLSLSGDSDVTVLNMKKAAPRPNLKKFVKGLTKLNTKEKDALLQVITQTIFNGCKSNNISVSPSCSYIKDVILGQSNSRNSIGSNIYNPTRVLKNNTGLRMVVIDGSNVAMKHTLGKVFSVKGLKICIDYFLKLGHNVKAFVPQFRCKFGKSTDPRLLDMLQSQGLVIYTPSREIQGKMINSYDDRYIVQCAAEFDGVIVTTDNYKDLLRENPRWRFVIENRLLPFTWVGDMLMLPQDPLGMNGPTLKQFLSH